MSIRQVVIAELQSLSVGKTARYTVGNITRVEWDRYLIHDDNGQQIAAGRAAALVGLAPFIRHSYA
jgi:hypothetical protein